MSGDEQIRAQAARFLARESEAGGIGNDATTLHAWLQEDPRHQAAYDRLRRLWGESAAYADIPSVRTGRHAALRKTRQSWIRPAALAASIAVVAIVLHGWSAPPDLLQTKVGTTRTAQLEDGSEVVLDTDSEIRVAFTETERHVELLRGQALFRVAKNPNRPFVVAALDSRVTALGTEFTVRRDDEAVTVTLLEGSVRVAQPGTIAAPVATILQPNEQIRITHAGFSAPRPARREEDVAWQTGRLVFNEQPLEQVVAEANRYATRKLRIGDTQTKSIRISGVFKTGQTDTLAQALARSYGLRVAVQDGGDIVLYAGEPKK